MPNKMQRKGLLKEICIQTRNQSCLTPRLRDYFWTDAYSVSTARNQRPATSQYGNVMEKYTTGIMLAGLVFALLNCFMGYKLRKIWGSILGFILGAAGGGIAGYYFLHEAKYAVIAGIAGAVVLGALAWIFYKLGIFVLCAGLVYALANSFLSVTYKYRQDHLYCHWNLCCDHGSRI